MPDTPTPKKAAAKKPAKKAAVKKETSVKQGKKGAAKARRMGKNKPGRSDAY
jgi:hypothetical protein